MFVLDHIPTQETAELYFQKRLKSSPQKIVRIKWWDEDLLSVGSIWHKEGVLVRVTTLKKFLNKIDRAKVDL